MVTIFLYLMGVIIVSTLVFAWCALIVASEQDKQQAPAGQKRE